MGRRKRRKGRKKRAGSSPVCGEAPGPCSGLLHSLLHRAQIHRLPPPPPRWRRRRVWRFRFRLENPLLGPLRRWRRRRLRRPVRCGRRPFRSRLPGRPAGGCSRPTADLRRFRTVQHFRSESESHRFRTGDAPVCKRGPWRLNRSREASRWGLAVGGLGKKIKTFRLHFRVIWVALLPST